MTIRAPLAAGTVVNIAAVSGLACLDPGPEPFPDLSARHPVSAYMALAAAPFGNAWELFALVASVFAVCFFVTARRRSHRAEAADG